MSKRLVTRFIADHSGATMVETALVVALVSLAVIVVANLIGSSLGNIFSAISTELDD